MGAFASSSLVRISVPAALATTALVAAATIDGSTWVRLFTLPGFEPAPELLENMRRGAAWWRAMLVVLALSVVVVPLVLTRLDRAREPAVPPVEATSGVAPHFGRLLLGVVLIGLLVRVPRLGESLWYDEIAAWLSYGVHGPGVIVGTYFDPSNHVGHTLLTWVSVTLLDDRVSAETALRLPALIASAGSILAVAALARRAGGPGIGLVAGLLTALLPVSVLEGVEARGYSLMICFSALASLSLLRACDRGGAGRWCLYAVTCAAGVWAHPLTVCVPAGHAGWLAWMSFRTRRRRTALAGGLALTLAGVVTVTLYAPVLAQVLAIRGSFTAGTSDQPTLLGAEGVHMLLQLGGSWYAWAAWPGLALVATGIGAAWRRTDMRSTLVVCGAGLAAYLAMVIVTGQWTYARFALFVLPGAIVAMALGLGSLHRRHALASVVAATVVVSVSALDLAVRPPKQPLRDAVELVAADLEQPGRRLLVVGLRHQVLDVYVAGLDVTYSLRHGEDLPEKLRAVRPERVIVYYPERVSTESRAALDAEYELMARLDGWVDWGRGAVEVWSRNS